jgi:hypothetical protein
MSTPRRKRIRQCPPPLLPPIGDYIMEEKIRTYVLPIMMEKKDKPPKTNIELELHCSR